MCHSIVLAVCPLWTGPIFNYHSLWFIGVTIAFLLISVVFEIYCNRLLSTQNYLCGNLVDEARKLNRYKQLCRQSYKFSIPFLFVWLSWFVYEATSDGGSLEKNSLICGLIGGAIGGFIGWRIYRKGLNAVNEAIAQIEELTEENE